MRFGTDFRPENVDRLRVKVGECLERGGIQGSTAFLLLNLMDELICNILEHSHATWVELELHPMPDMVHLIFRDDGTQFDPGKNMAEPHLDEAVESEDGRRMGLYMVSQIARTWNYKRVNGNVNELELSVDLLKEPANG
jgi:anti-sigma regulatory factor (Ser/Thr protein kinase)